MYTRVLSSDLNLSGFFKETQIVLVLGSFGLFGYFVCVKLKDMLRVGHGDTHGVEKGTLFLCLGYM